MLIYDGNCGFCTASLVWARLLGATCPASSYQRADLSALGLTEEEATDAAWFVTDTQRYRGHEALAMTIRSSRYPSARWLGVVAMSRLLRPVMTRLYDVIARNRYRLPGSTDACRVD